MVVRAPKYPNRLRQAIKHQGFKVKEVAEETSIPLRTLFDYCAGRMPIPRKRLELLAHTIGCPTEALVSSYANASSAHLIQSEEEPLDVLDVAKAVEKPTFATSPLQGREDQDECNTLHLSQETGAVQVTESCEGVNRREVNKKITGLVGGLFVATSNDMLYPPLWERLARTLTKSFSVDEVALQGLEQITRNYWQLRASIGYRNLMSGFQGHLETVVQLLRCPQSMATHKRLCSISSEIAQRIGAINFDMNDHSTAKAYYKVSIEAAKEAENYTLWAVGLGRMSLLPIYSNNPHEAIPLLREAQSMAMQHSSASIRAWLASIEAEAHANLENESSCIQLLGHAEHVLAKEELRENDHEIKFDYSRLLGYKGTCYLHLHKSKAALTALSEGAKSIDVSSVRQRSIIIADSAAVYRQMGEIEEACNCAIQALELTNLTKSDLVIQRLRNVRAAMQLWETAKIVKNFDEQMALHAVLM